MTAIINGIRYANSGGRVTTCASSWGLFGPARWTWQTFREFVKFVRDNNGQLVS